MKKIALDTNVAIDILNGKGAVISKLKKHTFFYLPIIVCGELFFGAANSTRKTQNQKKLHAFIKSCKVLNINAPIAEAYASIRLELRKKGKPIPENDIWIAAICKINNLPLFTKDRHFEHISGLKIVKP